MTGHRENADGHAAMISQIQNARFSTRWGSSYDEQQVDEFLDSLVQILSDGAQLDPLMVRNVRFEMTRFRHGYTKADVDALLNEVERYASGHR